LFLERGYTKTTMDDIAAVAGVSKQTVYTHYADKEQLFTELVLTNASRVDVFLEEIRAGLDEGTPTELIALARRYVEFVVRPEVVQLRRLVIGEATRFPDLARAYHEQVPERVVATLAERFGDLGERGRLRVGGGEEAYSAAVQFVWLVLGAPLDRALFEGADQVVQQDLQPGVEAGVRTFLAAYGPGDRIASRA
ncbi:MAG: TetR/AcrR family transcriptional regulator, partial [Candidatus Dormibacteraeota bacterium]|nr:TetR/AcrR family transcriptional regulator [Candidatus Dormibacteraeota bacterium]